MRKIPTLLVLATGTAALAAGVAFARDEMHEMSVRLPDGAIEQIRYSGDQPPQVQFSSPSEALAIDTSFDRMFAAPFEEMSRISAAINHDEDTMMQMARSSTLNGSDSSSVGLGRLPPGVEGYSVSYFSSGGKTCSTRIRYFDNGKESPLIQKTSDGDCAALGRATMASAKTASAPIAGPHPSLAAPHQVNPIEVKYTRTSPAAPMQMAGLF